MYATFRVMHANSLGRQGVREKDIKIPTNYYQATLSEQATSWREAMDAEMSALKVKQVLREIPQSDMPRG